MTPPSRALAEVRKSLAALAKELPAEAAGATPLAVPAGPGEPLVPANDVIVFVLAANGALVQRTSSASPVDFDALKLRLIGAEAAVDALAAQGSPPTPPLSSAEGTLLDKAGLADTARGPGALERSAIAYQILLRTSLSLLQASRALHLTTSRLRQRLGARTLLGVKDGRAWRIPVFQFATKGRLLPGLEKVLPRIRADAHPLVVQSWFQTPHQDLVVGPAENLASPAQWLTAGNSPDGVAELAHEI